VACFGITMACDSPDCGSIFVLNGAERMHIPSLGVVIGDRMEAAGWKSDSLGWDLCPDCSPRKGCSYESDRPLDSGLR
jgi:hypothetical protein